MNFLQQIETDALVVDEAKKDFQLKRVIMGPIRPDEVLVEMKYSGICHTVSAVSFRPAYIWDLT